MATDLVFIEGFYLFKYLWQPKQGHTASNKTQDLDKVTKFYWKKAPKASKSAQMVKKSPNLVTLVIGIIIGKLSITHTLVYNQRY